MTSTLGERLGKTLLRLGINHAQFSALTGINQTIISRIVRTKAKEHKQSVLFAEVLGINHDWLARGKGGMLNPIVNYIPVINDFSKLKLFLMKGFLEENTPFLFTEQDYGKMMFVTAMDESEFVICSPFEEGKVTSHLLVWTGTTKKILKYDLKSKENIFLIHEKRQYDRFPENIFLSELAKRFQISPVSMSARKPPNPNHKGGKAKMTPSKIDAAKKLLASNVPIKEVAEKLGVSVRTIQRWI